MILKEIQIRNIRSYREFPSFGFPQGTCLFFGDVGSGKSSLLYAIEFALFGATPRGDLRGSMLLRNGADEGHVRLTFEQDGEDWTVFRRLRRIRGRVRQVEQSVTKNGETHAFNVAEMKQRVLDILKLNELPSASASSVIYRYGVFTPQEQTQKILLDRPSGRVETLRRAFDLLKYDVAGGNAANLAKHLRTVEIRVLDAQAEGLLEAYSERKDVLEEHARNTSEIGELKRKLDGINDALDTLQGQEREKAEQLREVKIAQGQLPLLAKAQRQYRARIASLQRELGALRLEHDNLLVEKGGLEGLEKPTECSETQLYRRLADIKERRQELTEERGRYAERSSTYQVLIREGTCPTCERPIDDPSRYETKYNELQSRLQEITAEERRLEEQDQNTDRTLGELRAYADAQDELEEVQGRLARLSGVIAKKEGELGQQETELRKVSDDIEEKQDLVKTNDDILAELDGIRKEVRQRQENRQSIGINIATLEQRNRDLAQTAADLERDIHAMEVAKEKAQVYKEVVRYLRTALIPAMGNIELTLLAAIREEFDSNFQKYFSTIIGLTEIDAHIDEEFSPVIIQEGYTMPYDNLSGGEKTSLALAYRLALNLTVRKLSNMQRSLLILDEPTDGLSYAQVLNLREVFEELACDQIILVSHESEFLSFADSAFHVTKVYGVSSISPY